VHRRQQPPGAADFNPTGWQDIATWDQADIEAGVGVLGYTIRVIVYGHIRDADKGTPLALIPDYPASKTHAEKDPTPTVADAPRGSSELGVARMLKGRGTCGPSIAWLALGARCGQMPGGAGQVFWMG
jgi:hypothetical protein